MINRFFFYPCKNNPIFSRKWQSSEILLNIHGEHLQGWFIQATDFANTPLLIYYGGNAEDVSLQLEDLGWPSSSLLLMNYRGFGKSTGKPSEKDVFADALAIIDYFIKTYKISPQQICLIGRSIGSSVAAYVASQRHVKKLVLVTPFDTIANVVPQSFIFFPIRKLLQRYFRTAEYLKRFSGKTLVIAAGADEVIPRRCLQNLLEKFSDQIDLVEIPDADHQDIQYYPEFTEAVQKYILSS